MKVDESPRIDTKEFQQRLDAFFAANQRSMPWREPEPNGNFDAYKILVSEFMLQQTQVTRVIPKFNDFIRAFPTINALAAAPLSRVLKYWSGLGYNRRAQYVWLAAQKLQNIPQPWSLEDLMGCKGIGHNTAAAVLAYAYNQPVAYLETNIRSVILHEFFAGKQAVSDKAIQLVLETILDHKQPRLFYWAMMDYGAHLKSTHGNPNKRGSSYSRQTRFAGSTRQLRGKIIRMLLDGPITMQDMKTQLNDERTDSICKALVQEGLLALQDETLMLYNES